MSGSIFIASGFSYHGFHSATIFHGHSHITGYGSDCPYSSYLLEGSSQGEMWKTFLVIYASLMFPGFFCEVSKSSVFYRPIEMRSPSETMI